MAQNYFPHLDGRIGEKKYDSQNTFLITILKQRRENYVTRYKV